MANHVATAKARVAASKSRIDRAMEQTRKRIEASNDDRVLEKGGQTVCGIVDALKKKASSSSKNKQSRSKNKPKPKTKTKSEPGAKRKTPARDPCEDISTARKLIRCLDKCCAKSKKLTSAPVARVKR